MTCHDVTHEFSANFLSVEVPRLKAETVKIALSHLLSTMREPPSIQNLSQYIKVIFHEL